MDDIDGQLAYGAGTINREISGALASFWSGGAGPSHSAIQTAFELAGVDENNIPLGNKEDRVRVALRQSERYSDTVRLVEELLDLLRAGGAFEEEENVPKARRLRQAFSRHGAELDEHGFLDWDSSGTIEPAEGNRDAVAEKTPDPLPLEVPEPSRELLTRLLRRIPMAVRPLVTRRRGKPGIELKDEYDLQDLVEAALRLLYTDVRPEERSPSNAGSSSTLDFLVKQEKLAIEIKVTREGRGEKEFKKEIAVDLLDYEQHPTVENLLIVVYDLAGTFRNVGGFEDDFTRSFNSLQVETLVVGAPQ